jgi:hypothetical protein
MKARGGAVINQGTAKLLGLAIPKSLVVAAGDVLN